MAMFPMDTTASRMQCMEVWGGNSAVDRHLKTPGLQLWVKSDPFADAENGGDVYYVSSCASGRITRLLLADVSGHGAAAASISTDLRDLMRRNVNVINQSRFVAQMNQQFAVSTEADEFATALVCTFFSPTRTLQFCSAGHPMPLIYQAQYGRWSCANSAESVAPPEGITDTPLGAIDDVEYTRYEIQLEPGDLVLCVTDAFTESINRRQQILGANGVLEMAQRLDVSRPHDLIGELSAMLKDEYEGNLKQDDATALLFQADGTSPSLASDLLAPVRMLRGVKD